MKNDLTKLFVSLAAATLVAACATAEKKEPEAKEITAPAPAAVAPARNVDDTYNVVRGDHLWGISSKPAIYGNPYQWPLIYKANRDKIQDADLIHPGQVFTIDRNATPGDVDAAVHHARTRGAWSLGRIEESDLRYLAQ